MASGEPSRVVRPRAGEVFVVGRKVYGWCQFCDSIIRVNKPLVGGWHLCGGD